MEVAGDRIESSVSPGDIESEDPPGTLHITINHMSAVAMSWGFFRALIPALEDAFMLVGRNSRWPKKANHCQRPCSSVMRRLKKKSFYRRSKTT